MRESFKALVCLINFIGLTISIFSGYEQFVNDDRNFGISLVAALWACINIAYIYVTEKPKKTNLKPIKQWYFALWLKRKRLEEEKKIKELEGKD